MSQASLALVLLNQKAMAVEQEATVFSESATVLFELTLLEPPTIYQGSATLLILRVLR